MSGQSSDDIVRAGDLLTIVIREKAAIDWSGLASMIGLAVALDKPIILMCPAGVPVPDKLARVVDRFVEYVDDKDARTFSFQVAIHSLGMGGSCTCEECQRVRAEAESQRQSL